MLLHTEELKCVEQKLKFKDSKKFLLKPVIALFYNIYKNWQYCIISWIFNFQTVYNFSVKKNENLNNLAK